MNHKATEFQIIELRRQIQRLGVDRVQIIESETSPDGYELTEGHEEISLNDAIASGAKIVIEELEADVEVEGNEWFSIDLDVTGTLARVRRLPDNCGYLVFWRNVVDSDWSNALGQNAGVG